MSVTRLSSSRYLEGYDYTYLHDKADLEAFAKRHGLRPDWHEPDEQDVTARVVGTMLDNAFGAFGHDRESPRGGTMATSSFSNIFEGHELRVVLEVGKREGGGADEVAIVNLASLLAWASS